MAPCEAKWLNPRGVASACMSLTASPGAVAVQRPTHVRGQESNSSVTASSGSETVKIRYTP